MPAAVFTRLASMRQCASARPRAAGARKRRGPADCPVLHGIDLERILASRGL